MGDGLPRMGISAGRGAPGQAGCVIRKAVGCAGKPFDRTA